MIFRDKMDEVIFKNFSSRTGNPECFKKHIKNQKGWGLGNRKELTFGPKLGKLVEKQLAENTDRKNKTGKLVEYKSKLTSVKQIIDSAIDKIKYSK